MAEFCFDCFNKIHETNKPESKYIFSKTPYLCEECGEWKRVVIIEKKEYYLYKFRLILLPLYILWRIIIVPYTVYDYTKKRKQSTNCRTIEDAGSYND